MATTITSKYFLQTPTGNNLDFLDFDLRYGGITTVGESVQVSGSSMVDSVFARPGLSYDLANLGGGIDKIYLSGNLLDYTATFDINTQALMLTRNLGTRQAETIKVAGGNMFNYDNLVFANGIVSTYALAAAVYANDQATTPYPTPSPSEKSTAPQGAAAPGATLAATVQAYSFNPAAVGQAGETFLSTKPGINLVVSGGNGIDTVYVADGEKVDASNLGQSIDLVYFRGNWADYTKSTAANGTKLLFTRVINGATESVTVNVGNVLNYDKLIFADGAVTTFNAAGTITNNPTDPITVVPGVDPTTVTPLYPDDAVEAALATIRDAAQNNTASTLYPDLGVYAVAGVKGVTANNLASINSALDSAAVAGAQADTTAEVQTIVDAYTAILANADGVANSPTALTAAQYAAIGVTGLGSSAAAVPDGTALHLLDNVVDASQRTAVDTETEVQALADAANRVISAAGGTTGQAALVSLNDLGLLGITGVTAGNLGAVQNALRAVTNDASVDTGATYVVFGKANNTNIDVSQIAQGTGGFVINGLKPSDYSGLLLSGIGDVNGDGLADLLVGGNTKDSNGAIPNYVVFGQTGTSAVNMTAVAAGTGGFVINGVQTGNGYIAAIPSPAGDVNGDGLADFIIAEPGMNNSSGVAYVVFGRTATAAVNLSAVGAGAGGGFAINGKNAGELVGLSTQGAGDVNGDGLADLIVGAQNQFNAAGTTYIVYGKADSTAVDLNAIVAGTGGFVIKGAAAGDRAGYAVSSGGDINGDGFADLLVGAVGVGGADGNGVATGAAYVIFGGTQFATTVDFLGSSGNDVQVGTSASETFVGGTGNDTMTGNGGADVMYGGLGNDVFVLNASNITALQNPLGANSRLARVDGGGGLDTIQLSGGANIDFTAISNAGAGTENGYSRIDSVEVLDLKTDTAANTLTLTARDVIDMSGMNAFNSSNTALVSGTALASTVGKHQVAVYGDALDTVNIGASGWTNSGTVVSYGGHNLVVYNSNTTASQLLIEQAMVSAGHVL